MHTGSLLWDTHLPGPQLGRRRTSRGGSGTRLIPRIWPATPTPVGPGFFRAGDGCAFFWNRLATQMARLFGAGPSAAHLVISYSGGKTESNNLEILWT